MMDVHKHLRDYLGGKTTEAVDFVWDMDTHLGTLSHKFSELETYARSYHHAHFVISQYYIYAMRLWEHAWGAVFGLELSDAAAAYSCIDDCWKEEEFFLKLEGQDSGIYFGIGLHPAGYADVYVHSQDSGLIGVLSELETWQRPSGKGKEPYAESVTRLSMHARDIGEAPPEWRKAANDAAEVLRRRTHWSAAYLLP